MKNEPNQTMILNKKTVLSGSTCLSISLSRDVLETILAEKDWFINPIQLTIKND